MQIDPMKKDWTVCSGLFFCNSYYTGMSMDQWCLERSQFLCCSSTCSGFPKHSSDPKICTICLPGLVVYPKFACCAPLKEIISAEELALVTDETRHDKRVCEGFCCGDMCSGVSYIHMPQMEPMLLCKSEAIRFPLCCFATDCAFPPDGTIPMTFTINTVCPHIPLCFLILYPFDKIGCCKKVSDLFPDDADYAGAAAPTSNTPLLSNATKEPEGGGEAAAEPPTTAA
jgi:hypothetical protein